MDRLARHFAVEEGLQLSRALRHAAEGAYPGDEDAVAGGTEDARNVREILRQCIAAHLQPVEPEEAVDENNGRAQLGNHQGPLPFR
jgi:hypothetical protein